MLWVAFFSACAVLLAGMALVDRGRTPPLSRQSLAGSFRSLVPWLLPLGHRLAAGDALGLTAQRLQWAGLNTTPAEHYAWKLVAALAAALCVGTAAVTLAGAVGVGLTLAAAGAGYLAPDIWLQRRVRHRHEQIDREFLGFVDLLVVAVEAGLPLQDALQYVARRMGGVLAREMLRAATEIRLGASRVHALLDVGDRLGHPAVTRLVQELVQAERTGTPVAEILRHQASLVRRERRLRVQEVTQRAAIKVLVPIALFIFIPTFALVLSPAVLSVLRALR